MSLISQPSKNSMSSGAGADSCVPSPSRPLRPLPQEKTYAMSRHAVVKHSLGGGSMQEIPQSLRGGVTTTAAAQLAYCSLTSESDRFWE